MKKLNVVLVVPNYKWADDDNHTYWTYVPYGICLLGAMIEDVCNVTIIDSYVYDMSPEELTQKIKECNPDIVGLTCLMDQYGSTGHKVAELVKGIDEKIITIYGGVYATINPLTVVEDNNVDFVAVGEGENLVRDFVLHFSGEGELPDRGLVYKKDGKIINSGASIVIKNLDELPRPAYHLIDMPTYIEHKPRERTIGAPPELPYFRMLTSRGCPYGCTFCQIESISGKKVRFMSPNKVLDELEWLKKEYGIKSFVIADDNFFIMKRRVREILRGLIERDIGLSWIAEDAAVWKLDAEILELMSKSGCEFVGLAIESGTKRVLEEIVQGKPIDFEQAKDIVDMCKELNIYTSANFIIGFPSETWEEIRATLAYAEVLDADYTRIFAAIPLKNTILWDLAVEHKAFKDGYNHFDGASSWSTGQLETDQFNADELTILRAFEWERINFKTVQKQEKTAKQIGVSLEELLEIRKETLQGAMQKVGKKSGEYNNDAFVKQ